MSDSSETKELDRRGFLEGIAATGAALALAPMVAAGQDQAKEKDDINAALIGCGMQGFALMRNCLRIGGVRFKAVCDIWEAYSLKRTMRLLEAYKHDVRGYIDYREMLAKERDIDAVIIATPDSLHSEQTIGCLKAGMHVYCEKGMSNTAADARKMVWAARDSDRLLQIGYQRRSNPRYLHCYEKLLKEARILGRVGIVNGQWNRVFHERGWPKKYEISAEILEEYGYESMQQYRNWRRYRRLSGGPIVNYGSQQIDVYNWFLEAEPRSVLASGGTNYFEPDRHKWYDNVMAVFDYQTRDGEVRAFYQTIPMNRAGRYKEAFRGDEGTLVISESPYSGEAHPEPMNTNYKKWAELVKKGYLESPAHISDAQKELSLPLYVVPTPPPYKILPYTIPVEMKESYHKPHLGNFFAAIRGDAELNCPGEVGFATLVTALKVNEAIEDDGKVNFDPKEFEV